ncbi:hypothetical protein J2X31_002713 [Flavobacterium arsenatis]|uniref:Quinol oxidase subunit 4 n=1 Tax=Flavobacterium arsenatis TaxID=1484332 RepID=A0ABU1TS32_9FLAO|nr:hypothetical protein [Flavobacterium arsenatis]MDR6968687.1 hypothetical protein [Flavobacterium arsenatis]
MKISFLIKILAFVFITSFAVSSCSSGIGIGIPNKSSKRVPPGKAKKASGSKSAKKFAPGQNK